MISVSDPDAEVGGEVLSGVTSARKYLGPRKNGRSKGRHACLPHAPRFFLRPQHLSGCPPKSGPASSGSPVNLPFIFCG